MNRENLQRMADYIRTIPQEMLDMRVYRRGQAKTAECKSVGCVIGHCVVLDKNPLPTYSWGEIHFSKWSEAFTGLYYTSDEWEWCFGSIWIYTDNTPQGAAMRIEWLLNKGLPKNWFKQMNGESPLCYK